MEKMRWWTGQLFGSYINDGYFNGFGGVDVNSLTDRLAYTSEGFRASVSRWVTTLGINMSLGNMNRLMSDQDINAAEMRIENKLNGASHSALGRGISGLHYPEELARSIGVLEGMTKTAARIPPAFTQDIATPVLHQGVFPTCAAVSSATAATYVAWRQDPSWGRVSAAWLWNIAKRVDVDNAARGGDPRLMQAWNGTDLDSICRGFAQFSWQTEAQFPYHSANLYDNWADFHLMRSNARHTEPVHGSPWIDISNTIKRTVHTIKQELLSHKGVVIGVDWLNFWFSPSVESSGVLPMPFPWEVKDGGHAVAVVGWQDNQDAPGGGYFRIQNSWGPAWGDNGYGWLPFDYFPQGKDLVSGSILFS